MKPELLSDRDLKLQLLEALWTIRETAAAGLDEAEALARAADLENRIAAGGASPEDIVPDDAWKEVLYALVYRVLPERSADARRIAAVRGFLKGLAWDENDTEERSTLLAACITSAVRMPDARPPHAAEGPGAASEPGGGSVVETFERVLPVIRAALAEVHGLSEGEFCQIEKDLFEWFARFCRRDVTSLGHPTAVLLAALLVLVNQHKSAGTAASRRGEEAKLYRTLDWALSELADSH